MTKTTYIATAPDGTELTRKTDRTYTHAVLLEGDGPDGPVWGIVGFCGRLDLAQKKQTEHPGSIVVEVQVLGAVPADTHEPEVTEEAENLDHEADGATEQPPEPKITIGAVVQELLMDVDNAYVEIVAEVKRRFPDAKTTARSVASVAATLRKKGVDVPTRRKAAEG
ncbi:MAG: hypothetical protein COW54_02345 [Rhodobacteraceae bacterium CG17_big_fil_post_rev_8_21_14_2_50_63_15]|nr:hypothetical protein [Roseovarius sp.]PIV79807.1 MAG: hypothetical protein COW54_02345 [Rhodobacteraceae bacterium CG17_big_fil_post_rev_8_21_14_2_50_63_15]